MTAAGSSFPLDTDAQAVARRGLIILILGFGSFLLWACLAPLDQGVGGSGTVVVQGERKSLQSLSGGTIDQLLVQEGDQVKQGQILLKLNRVQAQAQRDISLGQWISAAALAARLTTERYDQTSISWPADLLGYRPDPRVDAALDVQQALFISRRQELNNQLQLLEHEQAALKEQLAGYIEIQRNQQTQLKHQQHELDGLRNLAKDGFVARNRLLEAENLSAQLNAQLASSMADIGRTRQSIHEGRLKMLQQRQIFQRDIESQLSEVSANLASLSDRLKALEFEVNNSNLLAPVSGQIFNLSVHTTGGVAAAGQKLLDIVPADSNWVIKAQFSPQVIDRLHPGLTVDLRFASLQHNTPLTEGRISRISADQLIDEQSKTPYFSVEIKLEAEQIKHLAQQGQTIRPGMQAEVMVKTGERTLMDYLLKPLTYRLAHAFTEE